MPHDLDPGSTIFFTLTIDGESLGYFNGCEGSRSQVEIEHRQEGGNNGFVWQLPSRVTFSTIRLTRPLTPDTAKVAAWISSVTTGVTRPTAADRGAARRRFGGRPLGPDRRAPGELAGAVAEPGQPGAWPTEVLEITHHGFTD